MRRLRCRWACWRLARLRRRLERRNAWRSFAAGGEQERR